MFKMGKGPNSSSMVMARSNKQACALPDIDAL